MLFYIHDTVQFTVDIPRPVQPTTHDVNSEPSLDEADLSNDKTVPSLSLLADHTYYAPSLDSHVSGETVNPPISQKIQ